MMRREVHERTEEMPSVSGDRGKTHMQRVVHEVGAQNTHTHYMEQGAVFYRKNASWCNGWCASPKTITLKDFLDVDLGKTLMALSDVNYW